MAKRTVVATLKRRDSKKPLAYVDRVGNVRHFRRGQRKAQHAILEKAVVSKDLLKQRKALKVIFFVKGNRVMKTKSGLSGRRPRRASRRKSRR